MSNELATIMHAANLGVVETGIDADTAAVAGNTNQNKRISIEGRMFRKIVGGKEQSVNTDLSMNVVFVRMAHEATRMFYNKTYVKGAKLSPVCWSADTKTPAPEVKTPIASTCESCPNSVKGSGNGGIGTACRLSWRTAVVLENDPAGDVYQLIIPAASAFGKEENGRWPFRPYVQMLANNNVSAGRVVTKMEFDIQASAPRLLFSPVGALSPDARATIVDQGKTRAAEDAVKLTVFIKDEEEEVAAPAAEPTVVRDAAKETAKAADVTDIVKKWTKK